MTAVIIPVVLSRRRLDKLHVARLRVGLPQVDDSTLMQFIVNEGYDAELAALQRLAAGAGAFKRAGALPESAERDLAGVVKD